MPDTQINYMAKVGAYLPRMPVRVNSNLPTVIEPGPGKFAYTRREPFGVCALVIPWNFPLVNVVWKLAPAVAAGNTVVIKVAEQTPLSALYFANLIKEAGFPPGVVNIINGLGSAAGSALVEHPEINLISFTGSTGTGKLIMKQAASTMKHVVLEAGGKSPMIVFNDADLEQATRWAHVGIMSNQGQVCCATSRILVEKSVYSKFVGEFIKVVNTTSTVGDPFADSTFQGPQVTKAQFDRILSYIDAGKREGATLVLGGKAIKDANGQGLYIAPTVFTDVSPEMSIYQEEIFGPFVVIIPFSTEEEAIELANNTIFGLGASVFTTNLQRGHSVAREIESGSKSTQLGVLETDETKSNILAVWLNSSTDADYRIPFGGKKQSGLGREWGEQGIIEFTSLKAIHVNLGSKL
ncbi:hypothetical protein LTR84_005787 [Exophiala bonariae]|uniref:aldehyde dehydrogenase (NAD(+)) n=1 Tax=Exophiala bonariae TaxID=1690606 RepID=A0AAV9N7G1_9EURO|nr:hypothetical protein LTR84_005787 [Exophiala bonariae]